MFVIVKMIGILCIWLFPNGSAGRSWVEEEPRQTVFDYPPNELFVFCAQLDGNPGSYFAECRKLRQFSPNSSAVRRVHVLPGGTSHCEGDRRDSHRSHRGEVPQHF